MGRKTKQASLMPNEMRFKNKWDITIMQSRTVINIMRMVNEMSVPKWNGKLKAERIDLNTLFIEALIKTGIKSPELMEVLEKAKVKTLKRSNLLKLVKE